jgi:2-amino-4-hydroxy-6-hydroxymethyldihydropteridine diphosphokinase
MADERAHRVAIALGSNQGDRLARLREAVDAIEASGLLGAMRVSGAYETPPESPGDGEAFLNAAVSGDSLATPRDLLRRLLAIESSLGRVRAPGVQGGPRTIDLDLVLHGSCIASEPGLQVPHPRFTSRAFVMVPLAEIEPDLLEPRSGRRIHSLLAALAPTSLPRVGSLRK